MTATTATHSGRGLRLRLLGAPQLVRADGVVHALERKDAALLALLALEGPTARAKAANLLWPDAGDELGRSNLRQRLFRLRRAAAREVVVSIGVLRLADDVTLDLAELRAQLAADPQAGRGDLLGGLDYSDHDGLEQWATLARERWRATRLGLLAQVASDLEARSEIAPALRYAQRMLDDDPLLEHAHRRVMRLHYLRGDRAAALAAYEHCRKTLHRELRAAPSGETLQLADLIARSGSLPQPAPPAPAVAILRPPRLVGRDAEWQQLERTVRLHAIALVSGEPGIGKTRLLGDFARAQRAAAVYGARFGDDRHPYALLARMLQGLVSSHAVPLEEWVVRELTRLVPELGPIPAGKSDPLRLRQACASALAAWSRAGLSLLVVDDLHFADEATLDVLPAMVAATRDTALTWLLAARSRELPQTLARWIDSDDAGPIERVPLGPLDLDAVRSLLGSLEIAGLDAALWAEPLARHAGGNPLFILETLIALLEHGKVPVLGSKLPAPAGIESLIERRLGQLSAPALELARLAALAGQDFDVELACSVLGKHALGIADSWRELEAAAVIREQAFAHDLILEATLRSVPQAIARVLHRALAAALRARSAPAGRVATHWLAAGEWRDAAAACADAASAALEASRRIEEAQWWERAIDAFQRAGDERAAFAVRCKRVDALLASTPVEHVLELTESLVGDAQTPAERIDALLARASTLLLAVRTDEARALAQQALDAARAQGLERKNFDAARTLALAYAQGQRAAEGLEVLRPLAALVDGRGDPQQRYGYWRDLAYVLHTGHRRREASHAWQTAIALAEEQQDFAELAICTTNLAGLYGQLGLAERAQLHSERARRYGQKIGDTEGPNAGALDVNLAVFEAWRGHYDAALVLFEDARRKFGPTEGSAWAAMCDNHLAYTYLQLGQTARAQQLLRPVADGTAQRFLLRRLTMQARVARALGKPALALLEQALALPASASDPSIRMHAELDASRERDPGEAIACCETVLADALALEHQGVAMKARLLRIDGQLRAGHNAAASAGAAECAALLEGCVASDLYRPEAFWILFKAFDALTDEEAAQRALGEAVRFIRVTALPHVPDAFKDSFLQRQPINVAILAAAGRRLFR